MAKGYNIDIRKKNKRNLILNIIRNNKYISKTKIKALSKLSMSTVISCIDELMELGYIYEAGVGESTGGRRPVWLKLKPDSAYFIGIEFNANDVNGAVLNLAGQLVNSKNIIIRGVKDVNKVKAVIMNCIQEFLNELGEAKDKVVGIGLGVPGLIDMEKGESVKYVHVPDWIGIPIRDEMEKKFGFKVYISKNIHAMAMAYIWHKNYKASQNTLFISIRTGVGMSCIVNNEMYYGKYSASGEIGHIHVADNNKKCNCGKYGCLDTELGYDAIKEKIINGMKEGKFKKIKELIEKNNCELDIELFVQSIEEGDEDSLELLQQLCKYLGKAVNCAIMILNPDRVIFSGNITKPKQFLNYITKEIKEGCMEEIIQNMVIECSDMGDVIGGIGAAAVVMQKEFGFTTKPI